MEVNHGFPTELNLREDAEIRLRNVSREKVSSAFTSYLTAVTCRCVRLCQHTVTSSLGVTREQTGALIGRFQIQK